MLSNTHKLAIYENALGRIERSWTKGEFYDYSTGQVCLAGAIDRAVNNDMRADDLGHYAKQSASLEIQRELADLVYDRSRYVRLRLRMNHVTHTQASNDGGLYGIEVWNDMKIRRRFQVENLLRERIAHYKPLAQDENVAKLERQVVRLSRQVTELQGVVAELNERVRTLEAKNSLLNAAKRKWSAAELRDKSTTLAALDDELEETNAKLMAARS